MSITLQKGQNVSLSSKNSDVPKLIVALGWDEVKKIRSLFVPRILPVDCDASAILLRNDRLVEKKDLVYFGNLVHSSGAVEHMGDNLTGAGDGDNELITVELNNLPEEYNRIVIVVNVYESVARKQHFGLIKNAFIRLVDADNHKEMYRYNLTDNYSDKTAMIFGEFFRHDGQWEFRAVGEGTNDTCLSELIKKYM